MTLENHIGRSFAAAIAVTVAGPAFAADLAVKAPQPVAAFAPSDIHGWCAAAFSTIT